jgi:DNA polymerase III subunit epsilon
MRQIILDTETTGLEPAQGHRIIEIGAVELVNRRPTGRVFHEYLNPERAIDAGAEAVHGLSAAFLAGKPRFEAVSAAFVEFVQGAELIIHNAPFDVGFLDHEFGRLTPQRLVADLCSVTDSLVLARRLHPGQRNTLDALCKRYGIDNTHREYHGALLDARLLADVYLAMTGGQTALGLAASQGAGIERTDRTRKKRLVAIPIVAPSDAELALHEAMLDRITKAAKGACLFRTPPEPPAAA